MLFSFSSFILLLDDNFPHCIVLRKGHDAGDHPPITPMKAATEGELDHDSWKLYDYITRNFIATVSLYFQLAYWILLFQNVGKFSIGLYCLSFKSTSPPAIKEVP